MYHNKVAFYYRAADRDADCLNELCIVGVEEPLGPPELTDATEERYYFGSTSYLFLFYIKIISKFYKIRFSRFI